MKYVDPSCGIAVADAIAPRPRPFFSPRLFARKPNPDAPDYLDTYYWWAYVEPRAIWFWERDWLINLVLFGNYKKLGAAALEAMGDDLQGKTLKISCCYGKLTPNLTKKVMASGGTLEVVDVMPAQINNLKSKLPADAPVTTRQMNACALDYPDESQDRTLLFFLLHELPPESRRQAFSEAMRVLKPGGKLVVVDYGKPKRWNPMRFCILPFLGWLEPFAIALWRTELTDLLADQMKGCTLTQKSFFGGLYQSLAITKPK